MLREMLMLLFPLSTCTAPKICRCLNSVTVPSGKSTFKFVYPGDLASLALQICHNCLRAIPQQQTRTPCRAGIDIRLFRRRYN